MLWLLSYYKTAITLSTNDILHNEREIKQAPSLKRTENHPTDMSISSLIRIRIWSVLTQWWTGGEGSRAVATAAASFDFSQYFPCFWDREGYSLGKALKYLSFNLTPFWRKSWSWRVRRSRCHQLWRMIWRKKVANFINLVSTDQILIIRCVKDWTGLTGVVKETPEVHRGGAGVLHYEYRKGRDDGSIYKLEKHKNQI